MLEKNNKNNSKVKAEVDIEDSLKAEAAVDAVEVGEDLVIEEDLVIVEVEVVEEEEDSEIEVEEVEAEEEVVLEIGVVLEIEMDLEIGEEVEEAVVVALTMTENPMVIEIFKVDTTIEITNNHSHKIPTIFQTQINLIIWVIHL